MVWQNSSFCLVDELAAPSIATSLSKSSPVRIKTSRPCSAGWNGRSKRCVAQSRL